MPYVELRAASAFSFLRAASGPEQLAARAAGLGLAAVALCDRDTLAGAPRFFAACRGHGVRPIVGAELTMEDHAILPVLAASREGYRNLSRLITRAKLRAPKGAARVRWEELPEFATGLVALFHGEQDPPDPVMNPARAVAASDAVDPAGLDRAIPVFGRGNVFVELRRHLVRGEERRLRALRDLAAARGVPVVATNGVRYSEPEGRRVLDVFTCLRHHTHLDAAGLLLEPNAERHLKPPEAMAALFADLPEAVANTERLAARLEFSLDDLGYEFPSYPVPDNHTQQSFLEQATWEGARGRYGALSPEVERQLRHELGIIGRLGLAGYFLIVWDLCNFCRREGILVQGRGSAANSAVCYSLGITAVDPVGARLLFERFLSEGRKGWPDIDLDLPSGDRRERVIQEVYRRYGRHGAAMTANVITYSGRSASREIGKALNLPPGLLDRFSSLFASGDFPHTLELRDHLRRAGLDAAHPRAPAFLDLYPRIHGLPRHLGQHSGGMVICQGRLDAVAPLENASMPGRSIIQWDKEDCEDLGIVKVDLLGLGMMAALQDALALAARHGRAVDLARLPKDDPATFALLCEADTVGVFQVESRAQMATLPRMRPRTFYDLVIEVAIIRPGPIQGGLLHPYLARRQGREPVDCIHPSLQPVLERTLGVPLFQEQVLRMAMIMADLTGSEAEELRRAMNFQRSPERLARVQGRLRAALDAKGVAPGVAARIVDSVSSFALYGFPESHAISFALIAYASAWLKAHRAPEFYCALLNNQPMGFYSPATLVKDAQRRGLRFLPVCAARSEWDCTLETEAGEGADGALRVRLGLRRVRGLNRARAECLLHERARRPFASLDDLRARVALDKDQWRALAAAGALNALAAHRRAALWEVEQPPPDPESFGEPCGAASPLAAMAPVERLEADYHFTGLTAGRHPMRFLRERVPDCWRAADLARAAQGARVRVAGMVICRQRPGTAKGVLFLSLEDETGIANAVVHPGLFEELRLRIVHEPYLIVEGRVQNTQGVIHVLAETVDSLAAGAVAAAGSHDFH